MRRKHVAVFSWASGVLALAGLVLLGAWAVSLYAFGVWVDEHGAVGETRTIDYVLFGSGCLALSASALAFVARRR